MKRATGERREQLKKELIKANQVRDELLTKALTIGKQINGLYAELYAPEKEKEKEKP